MSRRLALTLLAAMALLATLLGPGSGGAAAAAYPVIEPRTFRILESNYDVDTGIYVQYGQRVQVSCAGWIWAGVWFTGANGPQGWLGWEAGPDFPLPYAAPYSALGKLNGRYFYIGTGTEFTHWFYPSKLFLRINDNRPGNGSGFFDCTVSVYAA
jgi:hypothetical protein